MSAPFPADQTERNPEKRCKVDEVEKPGRTHLCRRTNGHDGSHLCICSRAWERHAPKPGSPS